MLPLKINNKIFLSYESKAEYVLEFLSIKDKAWDECILNKVNDEVSLNKIESIVDCINKIYYIRNFKKSFFTNDDSKSYTTEFTNKLRERYFVLEEKRLEKNIKEKYNLDIDTLIIKESRKKEVKVGDIKILIDENRGHIYGMYLKNSVFSKTSIEKMIDLFGHTIERR